MARPFPTNIKQASSGELLIEEYHKGFDQVYFIPPKEKLRESGLDDQDPGKYKRHILDINVTEDYLSIYPLNTLSGHEKFLKPKYENIESITLEGFGFGSVKNSDDVVFLLEELPSAFIKDYDYGLGLLKDYRFLIDNLEEFGIKHLVISENKETSISKKDEIFVLSFHDFETVRKGLNKITRESQSASRKIKVLVTNNYLSLFLKSADYPQKHLEIKNSSLEKLIAKASPELFVDLTKSEQKEVVDLVDKNKRVIAKNNPEVLLKLQNDIELVSLEQLIEKYEIMLAKRLNENHWQQFFNENPFILNMAFGYPVIKIRDQASVGGRKLSGAGEKITDFIVKNSITNNCALFEIKTPQTKLLNKTAYRDGVYTPSSDLSGSINQALDQKHKFQKEISTIKENSRIYDLESYHVHCSLIVGKMPEDDDKKKSFELFRKNSKDVEVITFDELLEKIKQLYYFLSDNDDETD